MKTANYFLLLFTIPFFALGIHSIRKSIFPSTQTTNKPKKVPIDIRVIIGGGLVLLTFVIGICCLFFGIKETIQLMLLFVSNMKMRKISFIKNRLLLILEKGMQY